MTLIDVLKNQSDPVKLIAPDLSFDFYKKINLSEKYLNINSIDSNSSKKLSIHINDFLDLHNKKIAYGGYLEKRSLYKRSSHFGSANKKNERNIHLGVDLWSSAGTLVLAAFNMCLYDVWETLLLNRRSGVFIFSSSLADFLYVGFSKPPS